MTKDFSARCPGCWDTHKWVIAGPSFKPLCKCRNCGTEFRMNLPVHQVAVIGTN